MLFSVLYGFWVANFVAFNGDAMRELAAQFLALAEKQGATAPLMIAHRLMGLPCCVRETSRKAGSISIARSHFTILWSIARWRRDLAKTLGWRPYRIGRCALWILGSSRGRTRGRDRSGRQCPRDRSCRHLDLRIDRHKPFPRAVRGLCGSKCATRRSGRPRRRNRRLVLEGDRDGA